MQAPQANTDEAPAVETEVSQEAKPEKAPSKQPRRWPFFVLAFIAGSAASIFALNYGQQYGLLTQAKHTTALPETVVTPPAQPKPVVEAVQKAPVTPPQTNTAQLPTPISSEEGEALIRAINALQGQIQALQDELQSLRNQQQDITHTQALLEAMQLHARLTWIIKPSSHLPQIKLAWQEISLLPSLSPEQRAQAEQMLQLAEQRQDDVRQWQQELDHIIMSLKTNEYNDIITSNDDKPWLQWLTRQFSLKRSQSNQEAELSQLKATLLNIRQNMSLEQWPETHRWTALRAQLQLRLLKQTDNTLQLPESFQAIEQDIHTLRQTAQTWLEAS